MDSERNKDDLDDLISIRTTSYINKEMKQLKLEMGKDNLHQVLKRLLKNSDYSDYNGGVSV